MQKNSSDKIDRLICKFVNMSDNRRLQFMQKLSFKEKQIDSRIKILEQKQLKLFELYFKEQIANKNSNLIKAYKKFLECKSKYYDNKILMLHKKSGEVEINMLYCSLVDKKSKGLEIEITK